MKTQSVSQACSNALSNALLILTLIAAIVVSGCGPVDVREAATPHAAFIGRWLSDGGAALLITDSRLAYEDSSGLSCLSVWHYEVVEQTADPFAVTIRTRTVGVDGGYDAPMTYKFSADRRQMKWGESSRWGYPWRLVEEDEEHAVFNQLTKDLDSVKNWR